MIKEIGREDILDIGSSIGIREENAEALREIAEVLEEDVDTWQKRLNKVSAPAAKIQR